MNIIGFAGKLQVFIYSFIFSFSILQSHCSCCSFWTTSVFFLNYFLAVVWKFGPGCSATGLQLPSTGNKSVCWASRGGTRHEKNKTPDCGIKTFHESSGGRFLQRLLALCPDSLINERPDENKNSIKINGGESPSLLLLSLLRCVAELWGFLVDQRSRRRSYLIFVGCRRVTKRRRRR